MAEPDARLADLEAAFLALMRARAGVGGPLDLSDVKVRETVTLRKFDHTPQPGEALEPFETVVVSDQTRPLVDPAETDRE